MVVLLLGRSVQSCHTSDGNTLCSCVTYDRVRAVLWSSNIYSKDVDRTFLSSTCKFLLDHAAWHPSGWTGFVMYRDVTMWCVVSVPGHCGVSWCLNLKVQCLDPEDEGTTIFQNLMNSSIVNTVPHAVSVESSGYHHCDNLKSHECWLIAPIMKKLTCHILLNKSHCTFNCSAPAATKILHIASLVMLTFTQDVSCCSDLFLDSS